MMQKGDLYIYEHVQYIFGVRLFNCCVEFYRG